MEFVRRGNGSLRATNSNQDVNNFTPALTLTAGSRRSGALPIIYLFILGFCFGVRIILNRLATTNGGPLYPLYILADGRYGIRFLNSGDGQWENIAAILNDMGLGIWLFSDAHGV